MTLMTRKRRTNVRRMIDLARRRGDGGVVFLPGAAQSGMHWLARDCGLGVSLNPTAGTLGPDGVIRASAAWLAAYVESTASTPASVDGPVGFLSDGEGTVGPNVVTTYNNSAGWTVSNGVVTASAAGAYSTSPGNAFSTGIAAGEVVKVTLTASVSAGTVSVQLYGSSAQNVCNTSTSGTITQIATVQAGGAVVGNLQAGGGGFTGTVSAVSVQKITGRHATQNSGPNKPTMRRGLVNLLTYSGDLTQWAAKTNGTATATRFTPDTSSSIHRMQATGLTVTSGAVYTAAVRASPNGYRYLYVNGAASPGKGQANFDLQTGTVASTFDGTATIAPVGDGSFICALSATSNSTLATLFLQVNNSTVATDTTFPGDGVSSINMLGEGIFNGALTAQQILTLGGIPLTTTVAASSSGGGYALEFGGSVTQLQASFAPTNAATVVLAVRVNSFAGTPVLVGQAAGGLQVYINSGGGVQAGIAGGTNFGSANGVITAGAVYVISVRIAVNGTSTIRVNGVVVATSTAITAAMNQTTISIGSNGSSNYTGGLFGPVLLFTSVLGDSEVLVLERGAGVLAPVTGVKF